MIDRDIVVASRIHNTHKLVLILIIRVWSLLNYFPASAFTFHKVRCLASSWETFRTCCSSTCSAAFQPIFFFENERSKWMWQGSNSVHIMKSCDSYLIWACRRKEKTIQSFGNIQSSFFVLWESIYPNTCINTFWVLSKFAWNQR